MVILWLGGWEEQATLPQQMLAHLLPCQRPLIFDLCSSHLSLLLRFSKSYYPVFQLFNFALSHFYYRGNSTRFLFLLLQFFNSRHSIWIYCNYYFFAHIVYFYFKRILTVIEMLYNNHFQWSLYYWDMVHIEIGISWFSFLMDIVIFFGLNEYFQLISECLLVSKFLISVWCLILVAASFIHFCMCI